MNKRKKRLTSCFPSVQYILYENIWCNVRESRAGIPTETNGSSRWFMTRISPSFAAPIAIRAKDAKCRNKSQKLIWRTVYVNWSNDVHLCKFRRLRWHQRDDKHDSSSLRIAIAWKNMRVQIYRVYICFSIYDFFREKKIFYFFLKYFSNGYSKKRIIAFLQNLLFYIICRVNFSLEKSAA